MLSSVDKKVYDSKEYISNKGAEKCKIVKRGTLLVSFNLPYRSISFSGRDLYTNEAIAAINIINPKTVLNDYLFYYFLYFDWNNLQKQIDKLRGITLNKKKLRELDILFPTSPGRTAADCRHSG